LVVSSAEVIRRIQAAGWALARTKGSHHHFKRGGTPGIVTVPHPKKEIPIGHAEEHRETVRREADLGRIMHYAAFISREGKHLLAEFPDCPGCQTFAEQGDRIASTAREALEGWLEAHLVNGQIPPRPVEHDTAPVGKKLARIGVRPGLAAALLLRWAREDAGLSQRELGVLARVSQQQIAKLENPDENPTLETIEKVARALGLDLHLGFEQPDRVSLPPKAVARAAFSAPARKRARRKLSKSEPA
jgi:predicted RNA binding protein YcfA (HicA-like mRNA interferase family)/transcriptional regulator with XRE-family HTH domain/predicted RNase H-like HicB family nuclease